MNELITIIINVYNGEKYIKKCLDCIINQTYENLEILIINDGSRDNTLNICKSYKDKRIRTISTENKGLIKSRNIGIKNAKGKYIYFIDVDDIVEKDTIEYLYELCKKYNASISMSDYLIIYDYNYNIKQPKEKISVLTNKEALKLILKPVNGFGTLWNKLIKKELFDNIDFSDGKIDDVPITYKLILKSNKVVYSNQIKYIYLKRKDSMCRNYDINLYKESYEKSIKRYENIKKIYPNFIENKLYILYMIAKFYNKNNEELQFFLKKEKAIELFNELFSIKILLCKVKFREKVKIMLFKINPKLHNLCIDLYLKAVGKK